MCFSATVAHVLTHTYIFERILTPTTKDHTSIHSFERHFFICFELVMLHPNYFPEKIQHISGSDILDQAGLPH